MNYEQKYKSLIAEIKERMTLISAEKEKASSQVDKLSLGGRIAILQELLAFTHKFEESENDRIRKELISFFTKRDEFTKSEPFDGLSNKQIIAWLEKQGEKTIPEDVNEAALQYVDTCPVDGRVTHDNINEPYWNNHSMMDAYKAGWLEKQGEQKPIDKVESKFKDGDVLYHKSPLTGIEYFVMSRGVNRCGNIDSYFRYNSEDGFGINIPSVLSGKLDDITPATKEQRDLLFQKMKEAGYEWDAEKKELRKIEQKPAEWSDEDSERLDRIHKFIWANRKGDTDEIYQLEQDADWHKSIKDRVQLQSGMSMTKSNLAKQYK